MNLLFSLFPDFNEETLQVFTDSFFSALIICLTGLIVYCFYEVPRKLIAERIAEDKTKMYRWQQYVKYVSITILVASAVGLFLGEPFRSEHQTRFGFTAFWVINFVTFFGIYRAYHPKIDKPLKNADTDFDVNSFFEEQAKNSAKLDRIGKFLEFEQPLIPDVRRLPFKKKEIMKILSEKEKELGDMIKHYENIGKTEKIPELKQYFNAVGSSQVFISVFTEIEPEDQDDVDYFNDIYKKVSDVPESEQMEFSRLHGKYLKKGMADW